VLRLHSTSGDDAVVPMDFDIGRRFRVLTQNTMLRPDDIITVADFALISAGLASPFTALAATALLIAAGVIEGNYDAEVQNTDDDNIERLNLTADRFSDYDIVALEEVFDQDRREQLGDRAQADFHLLDGPGPSPFIVDFSDVEVHIPQGASGVALLVRHGLSGSDAQTELAQMLPYHHSEIYGSSADSDSHANKGFVFEKVQLGSDPTDFIYVVDTHPQADYAFPGQYESVRAAQLAQIRDYVNAHADPTHPVLFMGDFNIREIDDLNGNGIFDGAAIDAVVPEYLSMLQTLGGNSVADDLARDYWNQHDPTFIAATSDSHRNAYSHYWFDGANNPFRQRLDFVLVRQGTDYRLSANSVGMVDLPINTQQCSNENWINNPPGIQCYVSDHFGLQAELRLERI
jgi:endonuclease/exonuclease/phosphatase family metal-dependent hydrolase